MSRLVSLGVVVSTAALLLGCASVYNVPINVPLGAAGVAENVRPAVEDAAASDDLLIGLAFSGGGTRAAAFSFGVLQELENTPMPRRACSRTNRTFAC